MLPLELKKLLYLTLIRPIIEYGSCIWNNTGVRNIRILESVQRRATKYILNDYWSGQDYIGIDYKSRLFQCNLVPLTFRREICDLKFIHECIHCKYGDQFIQLFPKRQHRRVTRASTRFLDLKPSSATTEMFRQFFTQRAYILWNKLPEDIKSVSYAEGSMRFRNKLRLFYTMIMFISYNVDNTCTWTTFCGCTNCRSI